MASQNTLPKTHRALVLSSTTTPPTVETIPTPQPTPGSTVVRVLVAGVPTYMREIYDGTRNHPYPTPLVIGSSAIARVAAIGPDATTLTPGQLVHVDGLIRGRDDPTAAFLPAIHEGFTAGSRKLMHGEWKDWTFAEYAKAPLENLDVLDEKRLLGKVEDGGLGYKIEDLAYISTMLVPYGGLKEINLQAGETIIVSPATGAFGGAAVLVALAMGARVIAMGRNLDVLKMVAAGRERVEIVQITGDTQADAAALQKFGPVDVFLDISPPAAAKSTHLKSGILALRHSGRVCLMGGIRDDVALPHPKIMHSNLQVKGRWMYEREDIASLVKMINIGVLKLGETAGLKVAGKFALEDWDNAFNTATENSGTGLTTVITP